MAAGYRREWIQCGPFLEVREYFAGRGPGSNRKTGLYSEEMLEEQQKKNGRKQVKKLTGLLRCNFSSDRGDLAVMLPEDPQMNYETGRLEHADRKIAAQHRAAFLKAVRQEYKRRGLSPLKWLGVIEKQTEWHHHIAMNAGLTLQELQALWPYGQVKAEIVKDSDGFQGLAEYLLGEGEQSKKRGAPKEPRQRGERAWSCSKNLDKPKVIKREDITSTGVLRKAPPQKRGYQLLNDWFLLSDKYGFLYREYTYKKLAPQNRGRPPGNRAPAGKRSPARKA